MTGMLRVAVLLVLAVGCSALDTYAQERLKQEACEDHCAKAYASVGDLKVMCTIHSETVLINAMQSVLVTSSETFLPFSTV
jgi:hypothetical protein